MKKLTFLNSKLRTLVFFVILAGSLLQIGCSRCSPDPGRQNKPLEIEMFPDDQEFDRTLAASCKSGIIDACYNLGFRRKLSGKIEPALLLFEYSCSRGHQVACNMAKAK
jgi:hypothetical protein